MKELKQNGYKNTLSEKIAFNPEIFKKVFTEGPWSVVHAMMMIVMTRCSGVQGGVQSSNPDD